jgi:hypothetical protein
LLLNIALLNVLEEISDMNEFRCTRNAPYTHNCLGHDDITARQGFYIEANDPEEAWQKMALRFPNEVEEGFTVQKWERFNVRIVEVKPDEDN